LFNSKLICRKFRFNSPLKQPAHTVINDTRIKTFIAEENFLYFGHSAWFGQKFFHANKRVSQFLIKNKPNAEFVKTNLI